jgi:ferredoxin
MSERLHIDWTACRARGLCGELLPELLDLDEWGYPLPKQGLSVPRALSVPARKAVGLCPRQALRLQTEATS